MSTRPVNDPATGTDGSVRTTDIPRLAIESANIGTWFMDESTNTFLASDG